MIEECPYPRPTTAEQVASVDGLLYFVWEREVVNIAYSSGMAPPFTEDPILRDYKFTNIRRRDDRVSRWIIRYLIQPDERRPDLWFTLLIARLINWPPTLLTLIYEKQLPVAPRDFSPEVFSRVVEDYRSKVDKIYSGAYMVYPTKKDPDGLKSLAIARHIIQPAAQLQEAIEEELSYAKPSIEKFVNLLAGSFGISTFMAGQVAADLTYSDEHLGTALDLYTYAPIGPGSLRGLNYLTGRKPFAVWNPAQFNKKLIELNEAIKTKLDITDLTLHDVQNVMCEYSKYARTVLGEGVPKTRYKPEKAF